MAQVNPDINIETTNIEKLNVQLFDITNNRQVFEKTTWGTAAKIDSVLNVSGITTSEAIFEIKLKCFNAADTINIHSFSTVYA